MNRYVPCGVLRLTKAQLDGASSDVRFDEDFFIDLIFAPVGVGVKEGNNKSSSNGSSSDSSSGTSNNDNNIGNNATPTATSPSTFTDSGLLIDPTSTDKYEESLHRDDTFWEAIKARKTKNKKRKLKKYSSNNQGQFSISDEVYGEDGDGNAGGDEDMDSIRFSAVGSGLDYAEMDTTPKGKLECVC